MSRSQAWGLSFCRRYRRPKCSLSDVRSQTSPRNVLSKVEPQSVELGGSLGQKRRACSSESGEVLRARGGEHTRGRQLPVCFYSRSHWQSQRGRGSAAATIGPSDETPTIKIGSFRPMPPSSAAPSPSPTLLAVPPRFSCGLLPTWCASQEPRPLSLLPP
jgi:hypothetical protein